MQIKLGKIADIQFGPYEKGTEAGGIKYLLAGHFDDLLQPNLFEKSFIDSNEKTERFLLKPNDVILAGKGLRTFAWAYNSDYGECVPSSLFYTLKTDSKVILGAYLACLLNSEQMQYKLKLIGSGATITSIPKKELAELKLNIPPIAEQQKIVEAANLLDREIELTQQLLQKKQTLKRGVLNEMIKKIK